MDVFRDILHQLPSAWAAFEEKEAYRKKAPEAGNVFAGKLEGVWVPKEGFKKIFFDPKNFESGLPPLKKNFKFWRLNF